MNKVWQGQIENGKLRLQDRDEFTVFCQGYNGPVEVIVRRPRRDRSLKENSYYWAVIISIFGNELGYTKTEMHDALLAEYSRQTQPNDRGPTKILRSSQMSTVEFEAYAEWCRRYAAQNGINIPLPNEVEV